MPVFTNRVWKYQVPGGKVLLYGAQPSMKYSEQTVLDALVTATQDGAQTQKICLVAPASTPQDRGFQVVERASYYSDSGERKFIDGVVLHERGSAVCMPTGDCLVLALIHPRKLVVVHEGREALKTPSGCSGCTANIVTFAYNHFSLNERKELYAVITGSIEPKHFGHSDERGQELVRPFFEAYGTIAFVGDPREGKLNSVEIVRRQCQGYGTPAKQVIWDGLGTYSHPLLASHREQIQRGVKPEKFLRNPIFVHAC